MISKTTPHFKNTYDEDKYMMKLLIILKQLNTSFKEFVFKRYTLKEEEFENTTYRKIAKGIEPWYLRVSTASHFGYW